MILKSARESGAKGQCFGALREDVSEELNVTIDSILRNWERRVNMCKK